VQRADRLAELDLTRHLAAEERRIAVGVGLERHRGRAVVALDRRRAGVAMLK
jgi:hypothetical protein